MSETTKPAVPPEPPSWGEKPACATPEQLRHLGTTMTLRAGTPTPYALALYETAYLIGNTIRARTTLPPQGGGA